MAASNFNTANRTYRQLLGNGMRYSIPPFQRDYSWELTEWEDLWIDIHATIPNDAHNAEPAHYMGYLVLQTTDERNYEVIDGQQRLTTISLIILAAMRLLQKFANDGKNTEENQQRLMQLRTTYIGYLDPVTLRSQNKLSLNRNNDSYYRDYIVTLNETLPQRGFPASTHAMRKGFEWFETKLKEHVKNTANPGMELALFVETMSDKLFFTVITVSDQLNAYKVFETLNARGVRLSATDLLKNYLFSVLARTDDSNDTMKDLDRRWEKMVDRLGSESFPDFLRMHWNSRNDFARQAELFKVIRAKVQTPKDVFTLLKEMDEDIDTYLALTQPEASEWNGKWKESAQEIRMFSVRQPYPMLMTAKRTLSDTEFGDLLRATVNIAFRYNVIGAQHTGDQERVYHMVAMKMHKKEATNLNEVLAFLRPIYPSDAAFGSDFAEKSIKTSQHRNNKIIRYILQNLEKQNNGHEFSAESDTVTVEHILPQSPQAGWDDFSDRDLESFVYRLANMVPLEKNKNRDLGNKPYNEKRPVLEQSKFKLTKELAEENDVWTPERINARQKKLARLATSIWRIPQLS